MKSFHFLWMALAALHLVGVGALPSLLTAEHETDPLASADGDSGGALFSDDGRFLVFVSTADNLVTNCHNGLTLDVFVREVATRKVTLVSASPDGLNGGNGTSDSPTISQDGRYVAFRSKASNLVPGDSNAMADIFLRDLVAGITTRVSVSSGGAQANGQSFNPEIDSHGRRVFFESDASNLVIGDENGLSDVFVRELVEGTTLAVSLDAQRMATGLGGSSFDPNCSSDGRLVVFNSSSTNLAEVSAGAVTDLFIHDLHTRTTRQMVLPARVPAGQYYAINSALTADGNILAFRFRPAAAGTAHGVCWCDLAGGTNLVIDPGIPSKISFMANGPTVSRDGRTLAFDLLSGGTVSSNLVCVWNRETGGRVLRYGDAEGAAPIPASHPVLSPDGQRLIFVSSATNLVSGLSNSVHRLYRHELATGSNSLAVVDLAGEAARDAGTANPTFSPDGLTVVFESPAATLATGDRNDALDLFALIDEPSLRIEAVFQSSDRLELSWVAQVGIHYTVSLQATLQAPWETLTELLAEKTDRIAVLLDALPQDTSRFFRVQIQP